MSVTTRLGVGGDLAADDVRRRLRGDRSDVSGTVFRILLALALGFSILVLAVLVVDQVQKGWDVLSGRLSGFLSGTLRSQPGDPLIGVFQGLRGTFWIGVHVAVLAFPIGVASAIYLEEYANRRSRLTRFVEVNIRNLAGVPSVVYGILGFTIFVKALDGFSGNVSLTNGRTVAAAGVTLAILVLPIVIITSAEAIRAVPGSLREAGYGVGATKWEIVKDHVLPYALPGILTGTVLALARALGEAAPLILVGAVTGRLSSNAGLLDAGSVTDERFTAMPMIITNWASQPDPGFRTLTAAAIVVLLVVVLAANAAAILLRNRYEKKRT
jgi:phosphate transport system permease protein